MGFDTSRLSFNPWNDYTRTVVQQGRPQLDSDWNEGQDAVARRIQAGTLDTLGRAVVPSTTPYAFKIKALLNASGQQHVTIGAGRMYVDGLLAENHGPDATAQWDPALAATAQWDPALAEPSGAPPGAAEVDVDYTAQRYLPGATLPTGNGPFLAYLDVWQRAVTYLEDPDLIEAAVGVDTTGRWQTVWQVKLLDVSGVAGGVTCATPDASIQPWQSLIQPPAARLTTDVVQLPLSGPCCLSPSNGYTGLENQLYRVEIHQGGSANAVGTASPPAATFKWSRDNASVATAVTGIAPGATHAGASTSVLTVQSTGKDAVLSFAPGDWIEIIDDHLELNGQVGELHKIDTIGVDKTTNIITLDTPVSSTSFPTDANGQTDTTRHTRIRRWNQKGTIYQRDGTTVWADLDAPGSTGAIPVPPAGMALLLEGGITVEFDLIPGGGQFAPLDYWSFTARVADVPVEKLVQAPPLGIHHHYARLATLTWPSTIADCRTLWPPSFGGGCACGCTITVRPEDITPANTLQNLLDQYQNLQTAAVICLLPGTYALNAPLRLTSAHSGITMQACQEGTARIQAAPGSEGQFTDGLVVLGTAHNVTLRGLEFVLPMVPFTPPGGQFAGLPVGSLDPDVQTAIGNLVVSIGVRPVSCTGLTIEKCRFQFSRWSGPAVSQVGSRDARAERPALPFGVGVFGAGQCDGWRLEGNEFVGATAFAAGVLLVPAVTFTPAPTILERFQLGGVAARATAGTASTPAAATTARSQPGSGGQGGAEVGPLAAWAGILTRTASAASWTDGGGQVLPATLNNAVFKANAFSDLSVAALILGASEAVGFVGNEVDECGAGLWLVSPLQGPSLLLSDGLNAALLAGLSVALGYPLPQGAGAQLVAVLPAPSAVRIYAGQNAYTDSMGHSWSPDASAGAVTISGSSTLSQPANPQPISRTNDPTLYQSERYGPDWSYVFQNLPNGYYQVTLKFAEISENTAGARVFDVSINDVQVLTHFDIFADAGGVNTADDMTFTDIAAVNNTITVRFVGTTSGHDSNAKVAAVEVNPLWSTEMVAPLISTSNEFQTFLAQLVVLGAQGFAGLPTSPAQVRIADNDVSALTSVAVLIWGDDEVQNGRRGSLLMSGNRLLNTPRYVAPRVRSVGAGTAPAVEAPAVLAAALTPAQGAAAVSLAESPTVVLAAVTRCLVSANMIVNESTDETRFSFVLADGALPAAEVAVTGNLFQGLMQIVPPRFAASPPPYPMNDWSFLNTVIP
jgi:hypothetical protein